MGGERGSTARQRMSGRICCICSDSCSPIPTTGANRLCARCTEGRQRLRDVYMSFMLRDGWYCQFLEADVKTPLPQKFTFATPEKSAELAERGRALKDLATKQALEHGIQTGRGGV